jgi:hypothetical protein
VGTACGRHIRDVALCYDHCYVRLSDKNFLASTDSSGEIRVTSGTKISSNDDMGYVWAVTALLNATAQYTVDNSTRLFAKGEWVGPDRGFRHIYSAAQCTADLSPAQCQRCLQDLVRHWWNSFEPNGDSARVASTRCMLRFKVEKKPFYAGRAMVLLPPDARQDDGSIGGQLTTRSFGIRIGSLPSTPSIQITRRIHIPKLALIKNSKGMTTIS